MSVIFNSKWSKITAKENKVVEIDINGFIGFDWWASEDEQNTKERMRSELKAIDEIKADKIIVNIDSFGGDVNHGISIHDLLKFNKAEIETRVTGMTASAATIIAQAGDTRTMSDNALYLVHNASSFAWGNKKSMEATIKDLEKVDGVMSNVYAKRSGKSAEHFENLMNESNGEGVWLDADETLDNGLIDSKFEPTAMAANFDHKKYGYPSYKNKFQNLKKSKMANENTDTVENTEEKEPKWLDKVLAAISPKKVEKVEPSDEDIQAIAAATTAQVEAAEAKKDEEINALTISNEETEEENKQLKAKLAKADAKGTVIPASTDKVGDNKEVQEHSTLAQWQLDKFQNRYGIKN